MSMTAVAVNADGSRFAVAWKDVRAGSPRVWWSESSGSASTSPKFSKDEPLVEKAPSGGKDVEQDHPALVFDAKGVLWVAWEEGKGPAAKIRLRSNAKGFAPIDVTGSSRGAPAFPVLAAGKDFLVAAWETPDHVWCRPLVPGTDGR